MAQLFDPALLDSQSALLIRFFVDVSIKGTVVLLVASGLTFAFRRASASARHLVWSLALASLLALPFLPLVLPAWQVAAFSRVMPSESLSAPASPVIASEQPAAPAFGRVESFGKAGFEAVEGSGSKGRPTPEVAAESAGSGAVKGAGPMSFRLPVWLMLIWLSGALMILARLLVGTASVRRIARKAEPVTDPARILMVRSISWQLGLRREVELLVSERISMPLTFGSLRSVVLLPSEAVFWDDERLQIVLLHELAHVKRKDCFTQLIAHLSCALHWFNPLIWIALRELRIERERACDDYVLDTGTKASDYASHLLDIARALGAAECSSFATVAIARRSQLEGRLLAILDPSLSRKGLKRMPKLLIALALISVILPLAAIQPKAHAREATGDAPPVAPSRDAAQPAANPAIPGLARAETLLSKASPESPAAEHQPEPPPEPPIPVEPGAEASVAQDNGQAPEGGQRKDLSGIADALNEALKDEDPQVRMHALSALARMRDPRAIDGLIQALKGPDPALREDALQGLALIQDARAIESLIDAVRDKSAQVREKAAWALGLQQDDRVVDPLIGALRDENWQVREKAAWALGLKGDARVVEPLIAALNDPQPEVKHRAAWALGLQGDRRSVDPLIAALRDENADVREVSAWALGLRGDKRAVSALEAAMNDPNNAVRQKARWALGLLLVRQGERPEGPGTDNGNDGNGRDVNPNPNIRLKLSNKIHTKLKNVSNIKN